MDADEKQRRDAERISQGNARMEGAGEVFDALGADGFPFIDADEAATLHEALLHDATPRQLAVMLALIRFIGGR